MDNPEFEPEFYLNQIQMMEKRYSAVFKDWHLNWDKFYDFVKSKLQNNQYWIWIFLCGFEKFVQSNNNNPEKRRKRMYKDSEIRIKRIIGDYFNIKDYLRTL